jgi:hypothetical protein
VHAAPTCVTRPRRSCARRGRDTRRRVSKLAGKGFSSLDMFKAAVWIDLKVMISVVSQKIFA